MSGHVQGNVAERTCNGVLQRQNAVVMMARVPRPGQTKTRMMAHLSGQQCADLHACFIRDGLRACFQAQAQTLVAYTPDEDLRLLGQALEPLGEMQPGLFPQDEGGLGDRLRSAAMWAFEHGFQKCAVIGSDVPEITPELINRAFDELDHHEVVLGPAHDGGYYLIAMSGVVPEAFSLEEYGHGRVFCQTMNVLDACGIDVAVLPMLHDMDTFSDAMELMGRNKQGQAAAESVAFLMGLNAKP